MGDCEVKLWEQAMHRLRTDIDWKAPDADPAANPLLRGLADDTVVASKMLYASHYFWAGLELRALISDPARGPGFWFVTVNRSRSDGLSGFKGIFVRRRVRSEVQAGALAILRMTKQRLER